MAGSDATRLAGHVDGDLDLASSSALAQDPLGLVGSDRDEPRPEVGLVADVAELLPRDEPRRLRGLLGECLGRL